MWQIAESNINFGQLKSNVSKLEILKKVVIRFFKLFLIGIFLNTGIPGGTVNGWKYIDPKLI